MSSMRFRTALTVPIVLLVITGCSSTVPMNAAEAAADPACANIIVGLRDLGEIDGNVKRQTDAQATAAWGEPATILLTCGVDPPAPSTDRCISIDGVDWLVDDEDPEVGIFTTYGRDPAVQVVVDHVTSDSNALNALANAVGANPPIGACTDPEDATIDPVPDSE